ncbi:MAG: hypothetical protein ACOYL6_00020 [Bacteriovoracaceae bacterium]
MKIFTFFAGIIVAFFVSEQVLRPTITIGPAIIDNNSFIIKRNYFQSHISEENINSFSVFLGSSTFARGVHCNLQSFPCVNLSLDGGDATSYTESYERYLNKPFVPKRVILELTSITLSDIDYSGPAIEGYMKTPREFFHRYGHEGVTLGLKQSLKNQFDSYFLWSGLNYVSRRNRYVEWPELIENYIFPNKKSKNLVIQTMNNESKTFFDPNEKKYSQFLGLIKNLNQKKIEVVVIATPEKWNGVIDSDDLFKSRVFQDMIQLEKSKDIIFLHSLTKKYFHPQDFNDQLLHLRPDKVDNFLRVLSGLIIEKESKLFEGVTNESV